MDTASINVYLMRAEHGRETGIAYGAQWKNIKSGESATLYVMILELIDNTFLLDIIAQ